MHGAAILLLMVQAGPGAAVPVDPVGAWLADEERLRPDHDPAAWHRAYERYREAGGTAAFREWQQAALKGVRPAERPIPATEGCGAGKDGARPCARPVAPAPRSPYRECLIGREVRVSAEYDSWSRVATAADRERLLPCYLRSARPR